MLSGEGDAVPKAGGRSVKAERAEGHPVCTSRSASAGAEDRGGPASVAPSQSLDGTGASRPLKSESRRRQAAATRP